jgi:RNA polymerase sigma-70 factor (ECF subfamily)
MVATWSERDLVAACQTGDRDAFRSLFETYKDRVYSIALRFAGEPATAMDITQDTFVKLFSRIGDFRGESSFESWLYRMVVNCCLDHKRKLRRLVPLMEEAAGRLFSTKNELTDELVRNEIQIKVRKAVEELPEDLRLAVVLRYTEGLSYNEMAEVFGCPPGTVASRLNRAHRDLARKLERRGIAIEWRGGV